MIIEKESGVCVCVCEREGEREREIETLLCAEKTKEQSILVL